MGNAALCTYCKEIFNEKSNTYQIPSQFIEEQKKIDIQPDNQNINIIYPNYYTNNNIDRSPTHYNALNCLKYKGISPIKTSPEENSNMHITDNNCTKNLMNTELSENKSVFLPLGDKYEGELLNHKPHKENIILRQVKSVKEIL